MSVFLECHQLHKQFDGNPVLDGIDFSLDRGECLVLLGPSGCGKSTLLNIIAGLLAADQGELRCDGEVLDAPAQGFHRPMRDRRFSMVFQDFSLWPHMTVAENVAFGLRVRGAHRSRIREQVEQALARVRMSDFLDRKPEQLSGGQQQRVAIARALAVQPRLLLLDEPLSALDARLREDLKTELGALLQDSGVTSVYVTHDQSEAMTLGDRIALMKGGRIEQIGPPEQVYREPSSCFVAEFLGSSNLLPYQRQAHEVAVQGGLRLSLNGQAERLPAQGNCMLRREAVCISQSACCPGDDVIELSAICRQMHFLGDRHEAFAELENGHTLRGIADGPVREGATVRVRFPRNALRFLPD